VSRIEHLQTLGQSLAAGSAALLEDVREGFFPRPAVADEEAVDNSVAGAGDREDSKCQVRFSNEVDVNGDTFNEGKSISQVSGGERFQFWNAESPISL